MRARAPGSLTGLYAPPPVDEPAAPSRGASIAIADGVTVEVSAAPETGVTVAGEPVPFEPVERVLAELGATATVSVELGVPLGHGFGASGAATLATALAANGEFGLDFDRDELVDAAHRSELAAGTGQGDVFVQARGGFLWSDGAITRREVDTAIEWTSTGSISTASVLDDEQFLATARRVGASHLAALGDRPTIREFLERSRAYLDENHLATPFATREIERIEAAGGAATMALFGDTVFATDVDGVLPHRTRVANRGARVLDE